ncbi:MAG: NAD(P)H-dependent oxidoreductase [Corynebacterium sp.]|nr:NAD(P)H-dependent oxidoreductase [Corynebacterium sp.]
MTIGIIIGSIREARIGDQIANWVLEHANKHDAEYTLIDLAEYNLPLVSGMPPIAVDRQYDNPEVTRFSETIAACDAFIVVTPEYNRSVPGALKNAIDSLGSEWSGKPVAYVSYSYDGGIRVADHLRIIFGNFNMYSLRTQVNINLNTAVVDGTFNAPEYLAGSLKAIFTELEEKTA